MSVPALTGAAENAGIGINENAADGFSFHVLDVGQGLSVLFEADGHYMLFDGGGRDASSFVVSYMKQHGIEKFDYVIASHFDEDHIAGLIGVLKNFPCDLVLAPDYEKDSGIAQSFRNVLAEKNLVPVHPMTGDLYSFGGENSGTAFQVITPMTLVDDPSNDNDKSLGIRVFCASDDGGQNAAAVCGDAEWNSEIYMVFSDDAGEISLQSDVYVVNHHGSAASSCEEYLDQMQPAYAVISCAEGNPYGHPAEDVLQRFRDRGIALFRTDKQGTIDCSVDRAGIHFAQGNTQDWSCGVRCAEKEELNLEYASPEADGMAVAAEGDAASNDAAAAGVTYVCNTSTKKFHEISCSSISQMADKNRADVTQSREELIAEGFSPCGRCNP